MVYCVVRMVDGVQLVCEIHKTKEGAEKAAQFLSDSSAYYQWEVEEYYFYE